VALSGTIGIGMLKVGGEMARASGGMAGTGVFGLVYLAVVLGVCTVGGIVYLESAIGGPISGMPLLLFFLLLFCFNFFLLLLHFFLSH
jgi:hypothetical protein